MTLVGHESEITSVLYSPDGHFLASGSKDGSIRFWETRTGREALSPMRSDSEITSIAFSPDGKLIASGTKAGHVNLWDTLNGQMLAVFEGHTDSVEAVAFHPEGNILASGSRDRTVRRWDVRTLEPKDVAFADLKGLVISLAFASDCSAVAVGFVATQEVRVWNADFEGAVIAVIKTSTPATSVAFSPDGLCLLTPGRNGMISWNWRSGEQLSTVFPALSKTISHSPDGLYTATIFDNSNICIRNAQSLHDSAQSLHTHSGGVNAVALSVDGWTIASAFGDGTVGLWNARSGEAVFPPLLGHSGAVNSVVVSPDGRLVVSASADNTIRIWDIATGAAVGEPLRGHSGSINALAFSPDGMWLASAALDKSVRFWHISLGAPSAEPPKPLLAPYELHSLAYSQEGSLIAAGDDVGYIWIWPTTQDEGRERIRVGGSWRTVCVRSVSFSPDGNFIVGAFESRIRAWDVRKQESQVAWQLEGDSEVLTAQFSPSGQHIVSGADDGSICIWDVKTKAMQHILHTHGDSIRSVFMTADHLRLVSCSEDGTIRVWNLTEVTLPASQSGRGPLSNLALVHRKGGWLVGASDELLLWVPEHYISNLDINGTTLIAKHKVFLTISDGGSCDGTNWTKCWRG